jgi:dTDP-4-dehydrorhamnose 3,5-epimerase
MFELSDVNARTLLLAKGIAHGFYTMSQEAIVMYKVSTVYAPEHDAGILWNSLDITWPSNDPLLSDRDKGFPAFQDFDSPFAYQK